MADQEYKNFLLSEMAEAFRASKEMKKLLKTIKKKLKKINCVATDKCQINFEQQ